MIIIVIIIILCMHIRACVPLFSDTCCMLYCRDNSGSAVFSDRHINIEPHIHELYIQLMAKCEPTNVYNYIRMAEGYRLEETLEVRGHWVRHGRRGATGSDTGGEGPLGQTLEMRGHWVRHWR